MAAAGRRSLHNCRQRATTLLLFKIRSLRWLMMLLRPNGLSLRWTDRYSWSAHSYGGMVISEAGKDPKVAGLLYVAALVPEEGQNVTDVNAAMPTTGVEKEFQLSPEGFLSLPLKAVNETFRTGCISRREKNNICYTGATGPRAATQEKVYSPAWKTKPTWYIVAAQDGMINPDLERFKAKLIKATTIELKSSHVPMISQPKKVADFIIGAAQELQSREAMATTAVPAS